MKRIFITLLFAVCSLPLVAQTPQAEVELTTMTFVRQAFERNFYNLRKVVSHLNMEGANLMLPNSANLIVESNGNTPTLTQNGRTLDISAEQGTASTIRVGAFHPYLCYEAEFSALGNGEEAGIIFYPNSGQGKSIRVVYRNGEIVSLADNDVLASKPIGECDKVNLRVQYTGVRFHVFHLRDNGSADLLYSVENDMRAVESCMTHSFGIYTYRWQHHSAQCRKRLDLRHGTGRLADYTIQGWHATNP